MAVYVRVTSSTDVGSCNACNAHFQFSPEAGILPHKVWNITVEPEGSYHSQSFRLCAKCREELLAKLR